MSLPYQPACDTPGPHQMTRDSDVTLKPSNNLGRWPGIRFMPTTEERHATRPEAQEGPGGSGTLRTPRDQVGISHLPLVSAGLVSTSGLGRVGP